MAKRTLSSAVAASIVLGSLMAPTAMAASNNVTSTTSAKTYTTTKHDITFNGKSVSSPYGILSTDPNTNRPTTFMPLYYVMQALKAIGVTYKWDGQHLNVTPASGMAPDLTNINAGTEPLQLSINGTVVQTGPKIVMKDPYSKVNTTYVPIFYIKDLLTRLGIQSNWDGKTWTLTYNTTASVSLSAAQSTVGGGTADALTVSVLDHNGNQMQVPASAIQWSVSDSTDGFVNPNSDQFFATKAGTYQITASYKGVSSTPITINVFGNTAKINLQASGPVVADGKSVQTIQITALDANGNVAANENGSVTLTDTQGWLVTVGSNGNTTTGKTVVATFKNGQASVSVQASVTPGLTDTLTTSNLSDVQTGTTVTYGQLSATSVAQQATQLQITPVNGQKYLVSNTGNSIAQFTVSVLDQGGQPMTTGTYSYNINVAGPATFNGATTGLYVGGSTPLPITLSSQQGATGTVTVTVSANSLQSATASVQAVIAQSPSRLSAVSTSGNNTFTEGSTLTFDLSGMDVNGYPTTFPTTALTAYVLDAQNQYATNLKVNGQAMSSVGVSLANTQSINVADVTNNADAGNYTLVIKDASGNTWLTQSFSETAAAAAKLALSPAANEVTEASPQTTLTLQFTDAYGNPVAPTTGAGVTVTAQTSTGTATLNGQDATKGVAVTPDANGQVSLQFTPQSPAGTTWTLTATSNGLTSNQATVSVMNTLVAAATVTMTDSKNSPTQTTAGTVLKLVFGATDTYGNVYQGNDQFKVSFPAGSLRGVTGVTTQNGISSVTGTLAQLNGTAFASVEAGAAQVLQVSIQDLSVSSARQGTATMQVIPGPFAGFAIFNSSNQLISSANPLSVQINTPVEVWVHPVDAYGNPVSTATESEMVDLLDNGSNGYFRSSPSSANEQQIPFPIGANAVPVYYVNGSSQNVVLSADESSVAATNSNVQMGAFTKFTGGSTPANGSGTLTVTLEDNDKYPVIGQAAALSAAASVSGVSVSAFTEKSPGVYTATVTSTANNTGVTITVKDGTAYTIGTSAQFDS